MLTSSVLLLLLLLLHLDALPVLQAVSVGAVDDLLGDVVLQLLAALLAAGLQEREALLQLVRLLLLL